ncbi:MAG: hypothetical protein HOV81_30765 [Kofleriaceae bacterium]|nr:hypothetical protein [Kofleriaceae bacterium]
MACQIPREWFSLVESTTALRLPDFPRASCPLPTEPVARPRRRSRVTLQALEQLTPLPREIAELRSDFMERDAEHAGAPRRALRTEGSRPHELFDLSGDFDVPSNDNWSRPMKLGELERMMSFELSKVTVNTPLPQELADLREDLEMLFPVELVGLSR